MLKVALIFILVVIASSSDIKINTMTYVSDFALARQSDLNQTFSEIQKKVTIPEITYTQRIGKTYRIFDLKPTFQLIDSKQTSNVTGLNTLTVSGAVLKLSYKFNWEKKQLGAAVRGTAEGAVLSDKITFVKVVDIVDQQPTWFLKTAPNITFSNSFTVTKVTPFNQNDSVVLFDMFNKDMGHTTGSHIITEAINTLYDPVLNQSVQSHSEEIQVNKTFTYTYNDYRGQLKVTYHNLIISTGLSPIGFILRFAQSIPDLENFDYGEEVPYDPQDPNIYGGHQSYINIALLKETARYALHNGFFDVILSQQDWQSRAFQFYVGDLVEAIPVLKTLPPMTKVTGKCKALEDTSYNISVFSQKQLKVDLNFNCSLDVKEVSNMTGFVQFTTLVQSYIEVSLLKRSLQFKITKLDARPTWHNVPGFNIENIGFANFLLQETVSIAVGSTVFGTGYPTSVRLYPNIKVMDKYLFLYDSSVRGSLPSSQ